MTTVLHVLRSLSRSVGGPAAALKEIVRFQSLENDTINPIVLTGDSGELDIIELPLSAEKVPIWTTPIGNFNNNYRFSLALYKKVKQQISAADIVHIHMIWDYFSLVAAFTSIRLGKPFILRPCGQLEDWSLSQRRLKKKLYLKVFGMVFQKASAIHFTTKSEEKRSSATRSWVGSKYVIPIGISIEDKFKSEVTKKLPDDGEKIKVLFAGRLDPKKQVFELILAIKKLVEKGHTNIELHIVGGGSASYTRLLMKLCENNLVGRYVTFYGPLDRCQLYKHFQDAHIFVLPSLQENLSLALLEAMSFGLPVIVSDAIALSEEISAYKAGLIAKTNCIDLSEKILKVVESEELYSEYSANALKLITSKYSNIECNEKIIQMYTDILSK